MIGISIWDIDMGYRYGISDINEISIWVSKSNMGYRYGIWYIDMAIHHVNFGHPGYRYGIWANDMGDDSIDMVILDIDMGYLVTLHATPHPVRGIVELLVLEQRVVGGHPVARQRVEVRGINIRINFAFVQA